MGDGDSVFDHIADGVAHGDGFWNRGGLNEHGRNCGGRADDWIVDRMLYLGNSERLGDAVIGTNIYLKRKQPRMVPVYDKTHVCKMSGDYVHFDGSSATENTWEPERDEHAPRIGSMDDLRGYLSTGEWELVDEYGDETTLEEVLEHYEYRRDDELWRTRVSLDDYYDREGYPWSRREFR